MAVRCGRGAGGGSARGDEQRAGRGSARRGAARNQVRLPLIARRARDGAGHVLRPADAAKLADARRAQPPQPDGLRAHEGDADRAAHPQPVVDDLVAVGESRRAR
eukprot:5018969-Prymnesium_polylepis.1